MSSLEIQNPPDHLVTAAQTGDAEAQTNLGRWYAENLPGTPYAEMWFKRAADQGLPRALHNLGVLAFESGDKELAIDWLKKAVAANWRNSIHPLGKLLEETGDIHGAFKAYEQGIEKDCADSMVEMSRLIIDGEMEKYYEHARDWCGRAVLKGNLQAHVQMAQIYHEGLGVERNPKRAASFWMTAARRGHPGAQLAIGLACETATGLREDRIAAMRFLSASAAQGNEGAQICLESLERRLAPEEKAEFERDPRLPADSSASATLPPPFLLWAAEAGDAKSQNELGSWYSKNLPESPAILMWFQRAADQGDAHGYHNLGVEAYKAGDMSVAEEWLQKSTAAGVRKSFALLGTIREESGDVAGATQMFLSGAERDCPTCQRELGRLAFDEGTDESYQRARHWDEKAAAQGDVSSQTRLGMMLRDGLGGERNPERAVHLWQQAARQGDRKAQYLLGVAHHEGTGTRKDRLAAIRFLTASAAQGATYAESYLLKVETELTPEEKSRLEADRAATKH